jgi:hypothetical protein
MLSQGCGATMNSSESLAGYDLKDKILPWTEYCLSYQERQRELGTNPGLGNKSLGERRLASYFGIQEGANAFCLAA